MPSNTFVDAQGSVWTPEFTTRTILEMDRRLGLSIKALVNMDITLSNVITLLWLCCQREAVSRQVSENKFIELLTIDVLPAAVESLANAITRAFPSKEELPASSEEVSKGKPF